jgi:hypothetical protein
MKNKNYLIAIIIFLVVIILFLLIYFFQNNSIYKNYGLGLYENDNELILEEEFLDLEETAVSELFDVEKITAPKEFSVSEESILESSIFSIPKNVSEIEMMSIEEKKLLGLDPEMNIQVLGRTEDGKPTGYQFIFSEEDFVIDMR